eukprot:15457886-Alexandrium_andersonii.AAC.1
MPCAWLGGGPTLTVGCRPPLGRTLSGPMRTRWRSPAKSTVCSTSSLCVFRGTLVRSWPEACGLTPCAGSRTRCPLASVVLAPRWRSRACTSCSGSAKASPLTVPPASICLGPGSAPAGGGMPPLSLSLIHI